jgi:hypothetical protein
MCLETQWRKIKFHLWKTCLAKRIKMCLKINFRTYLTRIAGHRLSCSDLLLKSVTFWDRPKKVLHRCAQERRSRNTVEAETTMACSCPYYSSISNFGGTQKTGESILLEGGRLVKAFALRARLNHLNVVHITCRANTTKMFEKNISNFSGMVSNCGFRSTIRNVGLR